LESIVWSETTNDCRIQMAATAVVVSNTTSGDRTRMNRLRSTTAYFEQMQGHDPTLRETSLSREFRGFLAYLSDSARPTFT